MMRVNNNTVTTNKMYIAFCADEGTQIEVRDWYRRPRQSRYWHSSFCRLVDTEEGSRLIAAGRCHTSDL